MKSIKIERKPELATYQKKEESVRTKAIRLHIQELPENPQNAFCNHSHHPPERDRHSSQSTVYLYAFHRTARHNPL
jgi:hypothetical protein